MDYTLAHQPAVISSMKRLDEEYKVLTKRRLTLLSEIRDNSEHSKSLRELRKSELKRLSSHLAKIENFLKRYGL
jgi:mRNA-degrading endonuclease RelE of RelBE toxin-antitoxin system